MQFCELAECMNWQAGEFAKTLMPPIETLMLTPQTHIDNWASKYLAFIPHRTPQSLTLFVYEPANTFQAVRLKSVIRMQSDAVSRDPYRHKGVISEPIYRFHRHCEDSMSRKILPYFCRYQDHQFAH